MRWLERTRRLRRNRFETYRKQTQSLKLDDETWDKIMDTIRAMEAEELRKKSAENVATAEAASVRAAKSRTATGSALAGSATPNARRSRKRRCGTPGFRALRFAACALLVVGVGVAAAVGSTAYETATHSIERATAGEPLSPYSRIELSDPLFADLGFDPSFDSDLQYDPQGQYYGRLEARLFLPGISEEQCEISILDAPGVRVCSEDIFTVDLRVPSSETSYVASPENDHLFSLVWPMEMSKEKFDEIFSDEANGAWDEREPAQFINSLRGTGIKVKTPSGTKTYRFDFEEFPDEHSLYIAAVRQEIRPIILRLIEESEEI